MGIIGIGQLKEDQHHRTLHQNDIIFDLSVFLESGKKVPFDDDDDTGMKRAAPQDFELTEPLTHEQDVELFSRTLQKTKEWHTNEAVPIKVSCTTFAGHPVQWKWKV